MTQKKLVEFFRYFLGQIQVKAVQAFFLNIVLGLISGVSLMLLIPFLHLVGLTEGGTPTGITRIFESIFHFFRVELTLESVLVLYVLVVFAYALLNRMQIVLNGKILNVFIHRLSVRIYRAVSYSQWQFLLQEKLSDLAQNLSSGIQKVGMGTQQSIQMISGLFLTVFHMAIALILSPPLTGFVLFFLIMMVLFLRRYNKKSHDLGFLFKESQKGVYSAILELLQGMKTALAFGMEDKFNQEFVDLSMQRTRHIIQFQKVHTYNQFLYQTLAAVAISLFFYISIKVFALPLAKLFLLLYIFSRLLPKFSQLHQQYQQILNMLPMFDELLDLEKRCLAAGRSQSAEKVAIPFRESIRLENVKFKYHENQKDVLTGVNLIIRHHEMTALTGPSGGGKTTIADIVLGLLTPSEGRVLIDGSALNASQLRAWRQKIGYVPQEPFLFHATIRENLTWVHPQATEEELWNALEQAAAKDFVQAFPEKLDTYVGDKGQRLSGGERQRICLARALLVQPKILIFDEATSHLDTENEKAILQAIGRLQGKVTLLVIAHRLSTIENADVVYQIEKGRVSKESLNAP